MADTLDLKVGLSGFDKAVAKLEREARARKINFDVSLGSAGRNPVGRIIRDIKEVDSAFEASTKRVIAFGATVGLIANLQRATRALATSTIEVQDAFARINVNLGETEDGLKRFGNEVFRAAKNSGQGFDVAATAAEELARQGLGAEESIKRLNDALILSRISGLSSTQSVEALTAAINTFSKEALDSTTIINKLVAVDTAFAVSSKDLAEGLSRVGSSAQDAGVNFDQLIALITAAQQTTARGGSVIGNSFKTIFTRIQRGSTLDALEELGIGVRNLEGDALPAIQVLTNLAKTYDTLGKAQQSQVAEQVGGVFQINVLKATLADLNNEYGAYNRAVVTSANATDQAQKKNNELNETYKSLINSIKVNTQQLFANIGDTETSQNLFGGLLRNVNDILSKTNGENQGAVFAEGIVNGISNVLAGPVFISLGAIFAKLFILAAKDLAKFTSSILGANKNLEVQKAIQAQINSLLVNASDAEKLRLSSATTLTSKKQVVLDIEKRISGELERQSLLSRALAGQFSQKAGFVPVLGSVKTRSTFPGGSSTPNFADPVADAIRREKAAGIPASQIYVDKDKRLVSPSNPLGLLVANKIDEPLGGFQGVNRAIQRGEDPKKSGLKKGVVPNFAEFDAFQVPLGFTSVSRGNLTPIKPDDAKQLRSLFSQLRRSKSFDEILDLGAKVQDFGNEIKLSDQSFKELRKKLAQITNRSFVNQRFESTREPVTLAETRAYRPIRFTPGAGAILSDRQREIQRSISSANIQREREINLSQIFNRGSSGEKLLKTDLRVLKSESFRRARTEDPILSKLTAAEIRETPEARSRLKKVANEYFNNFNKQFIQSYKEVQNQRAFAEFNKLSAGPSGFKAGFREIFGGERRLRESLEKEASRLGLGNDLGAQQRINERLAGRRSRISTASLGAAFALPLAAGFVEPGFRAAGISTEGGTKGGVASGALNFAAQGAGIGALFGPVGIGIGAAAGGLIGAFQKLKKSTEEIAASFEKSVVAKNQETEAAQQFLQISDQIKNLQETGGSQSVLRTLETQRQDIAKRIGSELLSRLSSGDSREILNQTQTQNNLFANAAQAITELSKFRGGGLSTPNIFSPENQANLTKLISTSTQENFDEGFIKEIAKFASPFGKTGDLAKDLEKFKSLISEINPEFGNLEVGVSELSRFAKIFTLALRESNKVTKELNTTFQNVARNFGPQGFRGLSLTGESGFGDFNRAGVQRDTFFGTFARQGNLAEAERARSFIETSEAILKTAKIDEGAASPELKDALDKFRKIETRFGILTALEGFLGGSEQFQNVNFRDRFGNINEQTLTGAAQSFKGNTEQNSLLNVLLQQAKLAGIIKTNENPNRPTSGGSITRDGFTTDFSGTSITGITSEQTAFQSKAEELNQLNQIADKLNKGAEIFTTFKAEGDVNVKFDDSTFSESVINLIREEIVNKIYTDLDNKISLLSDQVSKAVGAPNPPKFSGLVKAIKQQGIQIIE